MHRREGNDHEKPRPKAAKPRPAYSRRAKFENDATYVKPALDALLQHVALLHTSNIVSAEIGPGHFTNGAGTAQVHAKISFKSVWKTECAEVLILNYTRLQRRIAPL